MINKKNQIIIIIIITMVSIYEENINVDLLEMMDWNWIWN